MGRKFALIVANAEYEDAGLGRLSAPGLEAHDFAGALQVPHIGSFDEVTTLLNEVESNIWRAVARLLAGKLPDDRLLLYFSGHGVRNDQGQLYLAARNTDDVLGEWVSRRPPYRPATDAALTEKPVPRRS